MSLTGFNRLRRMKQVEEMKPENIEKPVEQVIEPTLPIEEPLVEKEIAEENIVEEAKPTGRRRGSRK